MEEDEQNGTAERLEGGEEEGGEPSGQLTSSRMGTVWTADGTRVCVSLLAEDSSMQVGSWAAAPKEPPPLTLVTVCSGGQRLQHRLSRRRQPHRLGELLQRGLGSQPA